VTINWSTSPFGAHWASAPTIKNIFSVDLHVKKTRTKLVLASGLHGSSEMTEPFRNVKREWMNGEVGDDAVPTKKVPQARPRKIKPKSALGRDSRLKKRNAFFLRLLDAFVLTL